MSEVGAFPAYSKARQSSTLVEAQAGVRGLTRCGAAGRLRGSSPRLRRKELVTSHPREKNTSRTQNRVDASRAP